VRDVDGAVTPEPLEFTDLIHFDRKTEIGISEVSSPIAGLIGSDGLASDECTGPTVMCDNLIQFETNVSQFSGLVNETSSRPFVGQFPKSPVDSDRVRLSSQSTVTRSFEAVEPSGRADVIVADGLLADTASFVVDCSELTVGTGSRAPVVVGDPFTSENEAKPCNPDIVVSCLVDVSDVSPSSVAGGVPGVPAGSPFGVAELTGASGCVDAAAVRLESSPLVVARRSQETRAVSIPRESIPDLVFPEDGLEPICWKRKEESAILRPTPVNCSRSLDISAVIGAESQLGDGDEVTSSIPASRVGAYETQSQWIVDDVQLGAEEADSMSVTIGAVETLSVADQLQCIDIPGIVFNISGSVFNGHSGVCVSCMSHRVAE